jgi:small subunit ribosomal protein S1
MTIEKHSLSALQQFVQTAYLRYQQPPVAPRPLVAPVHGDVAASSGPAHAAWDQVKRLFERGDTLSALVTGWNRGGLLVRWEELQGFVPISQLRQVPIVSQEEERDEVLARWVGEMLDLRVIELDQSRNRLVFSERATRWAPEQGDALLHDLDAGQVRSGIVSNICPFGVFIDLGGVDGLIHISELSWGRVTHPEQIVSLGQKVQVYVLSLDRVNHRVALSLKRLHPNPWLTIETKYVIGQITRATITNLAEFGAFAQLEEGIEGLIHISELSEDRVQDPAQMVQPGDQVLVRILRIDSHNHRLGLSMRQATEDHRSDWDNQ